MGMSVRVLVIHCGIVQYNIVVLELNCCSSCRQALEVVMSSLDKASFILGNEVWEKHFEILLTLLNAYIIEERKSRAILYALNNPVLTLQLGILLGLMVKGCVREVS